MNLTVEMLGYLLRFIAFNREQYNWLFPTFSTDDSWLSMLWWCSFD